MFSKRHAFTIARRLIVQQEGVHFDKHKITFDTLNDKPQLLHDTRLLFRLNNKYYTWSVLSPHLASLVLFGKPLESATMDRLLLSPDSVVAAKNTSPEAKSSFTGSWRTWWSRSSPTPASAPNGTDREPSPEKKPAEIEKEKVDEEGREKMTSPEGFSSDESDDDSDLDSEDLDVATSQKRYMKTLRLTSDQLVCTLPVIRLWCRKVWGCSTA
jgi:hypothetical protein